MNLKESIILSNLNKKEFYRSLSLNDKDLFNVQLLNQIGLAEKVLIKNGIIFEGDLINDFKQTCIVYNLLKDEEYFVSKTLSDAKNIVKELNVARSLCRGDEQELLKRVLSDGEFKDKNIALLSIYNRYKNYLEDHKLYDAYDEINYCINNNLKLDADYIVFKEEKLSPLQEKLVEVISNNNYKELSILEYANLKNKKLNKIEYDNSYGQINEIEHIISTIVKNRINYDDVTIVINNESYLNELLNYKNIHNVPLTFSMGYPIFLTNGFKVYELLRAWDNNYNCLEYLLKIFNANEFDSEKFFTEVIGNDLNNRERNEILKAIGNLRISTSYKETLLDDCKSTFINENGFYEYIKKFAEELSNGYSYLIKKYTKVREDDFLKALDKASINVITSLIDDYLSNIKEGSPLDIYEDILEKKVLKEFSKQGKIAICNLKDALSIVRKHTFITGLSASNFPGSPKENYLLLDSDLIRFNEEYAPLSNKIITDKKDLLFDVVNVLNGFDSKIYLSYSGYNLTELKEDNPSSMLFEIYKQENGSASSIKDLNNEIGKQHHYFETSISKNDELGNYYLEGRDFSPKHEELINDDIKQLEYKKEISPSAAEKFFECPRRFYLKYVLGLNEPDELDAFNIFPSNIEGTLVHECMEDYGNNPNWTVDEFLLNATNKFDNYLKTVNPIHKEGIENSKREYLRMVLEGYNSDPRNEVIASERKLGPIKHESGLIFGGIVDRIEKLDNGKYIIVDYKTYKDFRNEEEDIETCFQVMLYAYLLNKQDNVEVERCEYRYLRNPGVITIHNNDLTKDLMNKKIAQIKEAFDSGVFEYTKEIDIACKYCPYVGMCGLEKESEVEEDE